MDIYHLRELIGQEIIDYNQLKNVLKDYAHPRGKISAWLGQGDLIRVKKGLYVFGPAVARQPFSIEILANLIYGPSAISLNYALAYYGLIPEKVQTITSITNKRNKHFTTPIGEFDYRYLHPEKYALGIQLLTSSSGMNFLIATPEKALCDFITLAVKAITFKSQQDVEQFLLADLRVEKAVIAELNMSLLTELTARYRNNRLTQFTQHFKKWIR